ncbi:MAG: protein kinase [Pseudomonadota bacterium]|nr:protein kinase [Pseudomonadota bacterium]
MLHAGDVVDRFEVVELLGVGGLAQVYKVRHRVLGSFHALKVVTAGGPAVARRLLREGSIQAQLRHPNVVAVTDVIEVRGHSALVLEYVEGITLQGLLTEKGALSVEEALALFSQVLAGVAAAHAAGVLHRDLKPGNILLAPGPTGVLAKVTDFGLAKVLVGDVPAGAGDTIQGLVMGTPGYMAPEQAGAASGADARADVFALGVVLYEMLTGVAPFTRGEISATLAATLLGDHQPLGMLDPSLPGPLVETVERCLRVDRLARYADAHELARALYGDRPELAEVVAGRRAAAPLAISLPSVMPLRAAGVGSAAAGGLANPTMAPTSFSQFELDDEPTPVGGAPGDRSRTGAGEAPPPTPASPPSARGRAGWSMAVGLAAVLAIGAGVWFGRGEPTAPSAPGSSARRADPAESTATGATPPAPPDAVLPAPSGASAMAAPAAAPIEPAPGAAVSVATPAANPTLGVAAAPRLDAAPGAAASGSDVGALAPTEPAPTGAAVEPVATDGAAVADAVDPSATQAAAARAEAEASRAEAAARTAATIARLAGTWQGTWAGRPFTIALEGRGDERLSGRLEVLVGTSYRTFQLGGALNSATGRFTLSEEADPGWWLDGGLDGTGLLGAMRHPEQKKSTSYTAKRR